MVKKSGDKKVEKIESSPKRNTFNLSKFLKKNYSFILIGVLLIVLLSFLVFENITGKCVYNSGISKSNLEEIVVGMYDHLGYDAEVSSIVSEDNFYKVSVSVEGSSEILHFTLDGKEFVPDGFILPVQDILDSSKPTEVEEVVEIPLSEKPIVDLYVMSFCPYGNLAEETMLPVYDLLKEDVDWNIRYIVSEKNGVINSLHGQPETDQNIRELCVLNQYGLDSFWNFVSYVNNNCGSDGNCWEDGAEELGLNVDDIKSCYETDGFNLMKEEAKISSEAGVGGSPTLIINGVQTDIVYDYGNSESYKQVICSAFDVKPEKCDTILEGSSSQVSGSC